MLDHKKAKEIKSKSLGRKLQSFLSTHTRTRRVVRTRTQIHTQTLHRQGQVTARNGAEVESFIDEMFGQLTAGHCPAAGLRAQTHLFFWPLRVRSFSLGFMFIINSFFKFSFYFDFLHTFTLIFKTVLIVWIVVWIKTASGGDGFSGTDRSRTPET